MIQKQLFIITSVIGIHENFEMQKETYNPNFTRQNHQAVYSKKISKK